MSDLSPGALFRTGRALCSGCGAPMPLDAGRVACAYCGTQSFVERRLRTKEPDDWVPSHLLRSMDQDSATCGGCGAALAFAGDQDLVKCAACGVESKVERRLRRIERAALEGEDASTLALLERLRTSSDLAEKVLLAANAFDRWSCANDTLAGHMDELIAILETADPRLEHACGEAIGKLLCDDQPLHTAAVLAAAERRLLHPKASRALLWELGLGKGVCMKRLLDAADVLGRHGEVERCGTALWAANTLLGRNYPEHPTLSQIVLYRLLYLHGPVLGWALALIQGRGVVHFEYDVPSLLRFIDDCAIERPELVPEIVRAIRNPGIANPADYAARLELHEELASPEARAALVRTLPAPPAGTGLRVAKAGKELVAAAPRDELPPRAPEVEAAIEGARAAIGRAVDLWNEEAEALRHYKEVVRERSPLMVAACRGDVEAVKRLAASSDVDATNGFGRTALHFAAEGGHADAVRALARADRGKRDKDGACAIVLAAAAGHFEAVRALTGTAALDQEALRAAFRADHPAIVKLLLDAGADPDALEEDGSTPLMACAKTGRVAMARLLLSASCVVEHEDDRGKNALDHATAAGQQAMVALLLAHGAKPR